MVKWWDRLWGAVWMVGSLLIAYRTARWFADHAAPADLGGLRYGLIAFSGLFGLLVGAFCLSLAVIGVTSGIEYLLARAGHPLRPAQASSDTPIVAIVEEAEPAGAPAERDAPSGEALAEARTS